MRKIVITAAALAALAVAGCASTGHSGSVSTAAPAASSAVPATPAAAPAPAPSPDGTYTGSCDVSLSDSLGGQDYLTADISLKNTGNIGTIIRARVSFPQQGFAPIVMTRTAKVREGHTRTVHMHYPASSEQISRFQDVQLSSNGGDPCGYRGSLVRTFGPAH